MAQQNSSELIAQESSYDGMIHDYGYLNQIYSNLNGYINNPIGTIALMANLYAESNCSPNRLQGDVYGAPTYRSIEYTNNVDDGSYTRAQFISDPKGYGLAQWTIVARKTLYYDYAPIQSVGIGDIQRGLGYLHAELRGDYVSQGLDYTDVLSACQNATDLHSCTDYVLDNFEGPQDPNYTEREQIADDLWTWFFGGTKISVTSVGNGTAYVSDYNPADGATFTLYAEPASGEELLSIKAWDENGYSIAMEQYTPYTYTYNAGWGAHISIIVTFSGTPPVPPVPPTSYIQKKHMPIWMYPMFRK